jgi:hypothetical protein
MGKGTAVRSQMDIRICLRVREPRDADLILGQGAVNSGWHAHKLAKPGEFLISSPEHAMPERNRAYLLTDARRDYHAAQCAPMRPRLAARQPDTPPTAPEPPRTAQDGPSQGEGHPRPETALWDARTSARYRYPTRDGSDDYDRNRPPRGLDSRTSDGYASAAAARSTHRHAGYRLYPERRYG